MNRILSAWAVIGVLTLTGCTSTGTSVLSAARSSIHTSDVLLMGAAGLMYLELNSKSGWNASIQQVEPYVYDVMFGRSILNFEAAQPISGAAKEVIHTVCKREGGRWLRLEEGTQAQQLGVRKYAYGQLECHSTPLDLQQRKMQGSEGSNLPALPLGPVQEMPESTIP